MYRIIQPNIRGAISHANVCYARTNNNLMSPFYDLRQPTSYIIEVDANNLYGWAMSQEMPDGDVELLRQDKCHDI